MTPAGAVLLAPVEGEDAELRLWEGLELPAPTPPEVRVVQEAASGAPGAADVTAGPTLEDVVARTWEGLLGGAEAACPVCAQAMRPRWSAGAGVVGGRCASCATEVT